MCVLFLQNFVSEFSCYEYPLQTLPSTKRNLTPLHWRHNGRDGVSNHQPHDCLLNRSFRRRSKKTSNLRVTGLCAGNSPGTGEFPAQMASYAENVSIWWNHHVNRLKSWHPARTELMRDPYISTNAEQIKTNLSLITHQLNFAAQHHYKLNPWFRFS